MAAVVRLREAAAAAAPPQTPSYSTRRPSSTSGTRSFGTTPEHLAQQKAAKEQWAREQEPAARRALALTRSFIPPDIWSTNLEKLKRDFARGATGQLDDYHKHHRTQLDDGHDDEDDAREEWQKVKEGGGIIEVDMGDPALARACADLAKRVWSKKALWLTRAPPEAIARLHSVDLTMKVSQQQKQKHFSLPSFSFFLSFFSFFSSPYIVAFLLSFPFKV